jgi:hypothetical protein
LPEEFCVESAATLADAPTRTGEVVCGRVVLADRVHLRAWLARFADRGDVAFALEGCTGWRYVAEELAAAGIAVHVAEPAQTAFARGPKKRPRPPGPGVRRHARPSNTGPLGQDNAAQT